MLRRNLILAAPALPLAMAVGAQTTWRPARPIRFVVPFPPGGTTDILGRLAAREMERAFGSPVVVENRPGAGGVIGSDAVAKAAPDGTTILLSNIASGAIAPAVSRNVPYDPIRDFTPVGLIAAVPSGIAVAADGPLRTMADLIAKARAGNARFGSTGIGTSSHVKLELLNRAAGVSILHVPYRGSAPAVADVIGGQLDGLIAAVPDIGNNDRLRLLAVTTPERAARWPQVPSVRELDFESLVATNWFGISGPAGLPPEAAQAMNAALVAGINTPAMTERLAELGAPPNRMTSAEYAALIASEVPRWAEIARSANIRSE
ncbi:Bug family tripartite tricarboxylate transporter substrate binding protein [Muricoccus radiodurans]|uniref:Bug family tripartite tricarboxylate transporter substrate binding protein n=1 Tax=Muricoccus radiodurans TaxID=2231721 RepID=UPI003CF19412